MIKRLVENWENRKHLIREQLEILYLNYKDNNNYPSYVDIVRIVWEHTLSSYDVVLLQDIYMIDMDKSYSGDYIFAMKYDYDIYTVGVSYGSCSGCDALEYALNHGVDDLMTLALHIVQATKEVETA
jgi:hypothetical protein